MTTKSKVKAVKESPLSKEERQEIAQSLYRRVALGLVKWTGLSEDHKKSIIHWAHFVHGLTGVTIAAELRLNPKTVSKFTVALHQEVIESIGKGLSLQEDIYDMIRTGNSCITKAIRAGDYKAQWEIFERMIKLKKELGVYGNQVPEDPDVNVHIHLSQDEKELKEIRESLFSYIVENATEQDLKRLPVLQPTGTSEADK